MKFYEMVVTVYLNKNIHFKNANECISRHINRAMAEDPKLKELHKETGLKFYIFSSFYPVEKDRVYKANKIYIFRLRALREDFIRTLSQHIKQVDTVCFNVIATDIKQRKEQFVDQLYTVTPVIVSIDRRKHWTKEHSFELLKNHLHANAEKKYNQFFNANVQIDSFISGIELLNPYTIPIPYKKGYLLGNKLILHIKTDEASQKLATMVLASGLGEKNSIGMGYCHAQ